MSGPADAAAPRLLESRSIDFIPAAERHGSPRSLFTLWFSSNLTILGVSIGALGVTSGLSLGWTLAALVVGNAVGTLFMAAHSAQGPHLGIPQMIQSRAQFGVLGAGIPLLAVVLMYLLYCAANTLLVADSVATLLPVGPSGAMALFTLLTLLLAFAGYRAIHGLGAVMTIVSPLVFLSAYGLLLHRGQGPILPVVEPAFSGVAFTLVATQSAAWGLSYGPYVADYSRYLPERTTASVTFWYTAAGCFGGSVLIMAFGALLAVRVGSLAGDVGGALAALFGPLQLPVRALIVLGVVQGNVMNLYSGYMAAATIFSGIRRQPRLDARTKFIAMASIGALAFAIAQLSVGHVAEFLADMLNVLVYLITPWSAINLADYYLVRKGEYRIADMYRIDGLYGAFQWRGIVVYALGILVQVPFVHLSGFTGVAAASLGVDVAWVPGLVVPALLYTLAYRRSAPAA
jgi:NCS1 family nucleobase:cation symporter-1